MKLQKRIINILFWSVVSAAFIGPGTVTTAAKSGALFSGELLWVLLFSTLACLALQEAASRITILTGRNLGEIIAGMRGRSRMIFPFAVLIALAICGGAAAYEMGNLIGAREGIMLLFPQAGRFIIPLLGILAFSILLVPSLKFIARFMGILVMLLGILFLYAAVKVGPNFSEIMSGLFIPKMPAGMEAPWLALALIGTTIVPYNLFLGSGISKAHDLKEMRWGLSIAILLGGFFSMAIIIVGSAIRGAFSFNALASALSDQTGMKGNLVLGIGLFAAGFTSAVTAPLASAITLQSLFGHQHTRKWTTGGIYFRLSWFVVLLTGIFFGMINVQPIPAIILAQALNGLILPLVSFLLVYLVHNKKLTGVANNTANSVILAVTLVVTLIIGLNNLVLSITRSLHLIVNNPKTAFIIYTLAAVIITGVFFLIIRKKN